MLEPRTRMSFPRDVGHPFKRSEQRAASNSMENILDFSGTKWNAQGLEPVMVHDILSNDIPDIRDSDSLEVTAIIHATKDDGDHSDSTSQLCLEDDADLGDIRVKLQDCG
ncbi:hypothetical protein JD844_000437 [Phrynosoma platyrhinos]|uniref:Uncharacterized protein n=1 Tax=Phrynosoma platyrhinos TaxID=52577 RepID=A0ABQ7SQK2_PHRPL|nr:hypothetical protein JD844_000437 [Phrynosoma platyrhinos]